METNSARRHCQGRPRNDQSGRRTIRLQSSRGELNEVDLKGPALSNVGNIHSPDGASVDEIHEISMGRYWWELCIVIVIVIVVALVDPRQHLASSDLPRRSSLQSSTNFIPPAT
ncbi:hypothetical protein CLCR_01343 [Cladophialophora carrionii]|uniref:Uncharacterized protein n=1 Tax=Cladophialophora carrionii TaxID=86049 RepID=A0A1C1CCB1_9EURO|nr:hypothetical protein CLCR_01343 [Cladophialophora carrionii]